MTILDEIRKRKLASLSSSINYSEHYEKAVSRKAAFVKTRLADPEHEVDEHTLYGIYLGMLGDYSGGRRRNLPTLLNKRGEAVWKRALARFQEAGVDAHVFMKAQFVFFSKAFGMAPEPKHFTTEKAVERAQAFDPATFQSRVVASALVHKSEVADVLQWADKQLREICRVQKMTRAEVYEKLIIPGIYTLPEVFLKADPEYRKALDSSKSSGE